MRRSKKVHFSEDAKERIGCFIMLVMLVFVMVFFWTRSNRNIDTGLKKLDYCNDKGWTGLKCEENWDAINIK